MANIGSDEISIAGSPRFTYAHLSGRPRLVEVELQGGLRPCPTVNDNDGVVMESENGVYPQAYSL